MENIVDPCFKSHMDWSANSKGWFGGKGRSVGLYR